MISVIFCCCVLLAAALLISTFRRISIFFLLQDKGSKYLLEANQVTTSKNGNVFLNNFAVDTSLLDTITKPFVLGLTFNWCFILNALLVFDRSLHHQVHSIYVIAFLTDNLIHVHSNGLNVELEHLQLVLGNAPEEDMVSQHLKLSLCLLSYLLFHHHVVVKSIKVCKKRVLFHFD